MSYTAKMTEFAMDLGINRAALMEGFAQASAGYDDAMLVAAEAFMEGDPSEDVRRAITQLNPDVIVPDVLGLTDDSDVIAATKAFQETAPNYVEGQYAFDVLVGTAVAHEVAAIVNSPDATKILPYKAVAVVEVNANRGFPAGREDAYGAYGIKQGHLGHVVIDAYHHTETAIGSSREEHELPMDYMTETGSFPNPASGLARNAARIRVRSAYPLVPTSIDRLAAREIFAAREAHRRGEGELPSGVLPEYGVVRGEYRICRAVALAHDLSDWRPDDFEDRDSAIERMFAHEQPAR